MTAEQIYIQVLNDIEQLPQGKVWNYISGNNRLKILEFDRKTSTLRVARQGKKGAEKFTVPFSAIQKACDAFAHGVPVHFDTLLGGSGFARSAAETVLAHTPHVGHKKIEGRKNILWFDYPLHPSGEIFNLDSADWTEPEWALATVIYETTVAKNNRSTIPAPVAKLLTKTSTNRDSQSWQMRIANIRTARKGVLAGKKGFGGGPGTLKRAAFWEKKYAASPDEVKGLAVFALKPCQQAAELAATLGLPLSSIGITPASIGTNIIFFGPPGTGKSTLVKNRVGSSPFFRTQFHPEYTHADFLGCYRPVVGSETDTSDQITAYDGTQLTRPVNYFDFVPGPLLKALERAFGIIGQPPPASEQVYLIIEEINRGDCAAIFGDAFQLLDRDNKGISEFGIDPKPEVLQYLRSKKINYDLAGDGKLRLPPRLTLLATMNTSDQSLYPMDSAFKRRWQWVACPLDFETLLEYTKPTRPFLDDGHEKWDWIRLLQAVNKGIVRDRMEDKQIGPWFIQPEPNGQISFEAFLNKCLFYLWHDVFKDAQLSDLSPFKTDGPEVFGDVQINIRQNGLKAGFKNNLLEEVSPIPPGTPPPLPEGQPEAPEATPPKKAKKA